MTPIELRQKGYQALVKELGQVDAIRFLQLEFRLKNQTVKSSLIIRTHKKKT